VNEWEVTYIATKKYVVTIEAQSEIEAKAKFQAGDYDGKETEVDCHDLEITAVQELR